MLNKFSIANVESVNEASEILKESKGVIFAGGTDVLGQLKREIYDESPEVLVNLQEVPGLSYISDEDTGIRIGAMTKLADIAENQSVKEKYSALAEAAYRVATPQIRNVATIGGNICQEVRCWYYRGIDNYFDCMRKGGDICYAMDGENQYHSVFGGIKMKATPCETECPNANCIPEIMEIMREGDVQASAEAMYKSNPLAAVTGRVCPHTCEIKCNRNEIDEAVAIHEVERFLGDYILENHEKFFVKGRDKGKKIAIVGAGPAGLMTSIKLAESGYTVEVIDQNDEIGGMLTYGIPSYRLDKAVLRRLKTAMTGMGIRFTLGKKVGASELDELCNSYDATYIAIGAWKPARTNFKGEEAEGVVAAIDFLKDIAEQKDIELGKKVVVVGGGSVAMDAALSAKRLGCTDVTVVCLESEEEMPAVAEEVDQAQEEGVKLIPSFGVKEIKANNGCVSEILLMECTSVFNDDHHFAPVYNEGNTKSIGADMVILATGQSIDLNGFEALETERGIKVNEKTLETSIQGVFAGGDCVLGPATVVKSLDLGKRAAASIRIYLGEVEEEISSKLGHLLKFSNNCTAHSQKYEAEYADIDARVIDEEDKKTAEKAEIDSECNRCMNCGCVAVNCSDIAPALIALDAKIITNRREIAAEKFWSANSESSTVLAHGEIVVEIVIPALEAGAKSAYMKFSDRETIDFPIVGCAAVIGDNTRNICLNAVYANPYRAFKAEAFLENREITEENAEKAAEIVFKDAINLKNNKYKIQIGKTILKRTIMACR